MTVLRLFDVSQYISAGVGKAVVSRGVIESQGVYRSNEMPCAGINFLLNTIHEFYDENTDLVFCFDRTPTFKRELHESLFPSMGGYKGNRKKKEDHIVFQRNLAEEIIRQIGFNVIAVDGYEADDCIASLVMAYKHDYEKIYVHNKDSDMFYLVTDNVIIAPVGDSGKTITLTNWEYTVKNNYIVPYNTLTLDKLIRGEMGDNIPHISKAMADRIMDSIPTSLYNKCGNNTLLKKWVLKATDNDPVVAGTLELITPLNVPYDLIETRESEFNKEVYEFYAAELGNKYYKRFNAKPYPIGDDVIEHYLSLYNRR